jgi:histone deacetylase 1/2
MKPFRLKLTHNLILSYGLQKEMDCYIPHAADHMEMTVFHGDDYIRFLNKISPDVGRQFTNQCRKFNVGPDQDCPSFEGLYEFCQLISGASIDAAVQLCLDRSDIAINWSGGFHHAQKRQASGFCYVNGE